MRAVAQSIEATLAWRQGEDVVAKALFLDALPHLGQAPAPRLLISVPADLGVIATFQGDYSEGQSYLEEALAAARAAGYRVDEAITLGNLAWLALMQEAYPTARALGEESEALARALGDDDALCLSLITLVRVVLGQGDLFHVVPALVEEISE